METTAMHLSGLDATIFVAYMILVLAIGFYVARREKATAEDYFLAGDRLPWYAIGFSLIASSISTEQFVGEVGFAYKYGLVVANWEWGVLPALMILLAFFVPFYLRRRIATMPQYLEFRFGSSSRIVYAIITVVSYTFVNLAAVLFSGGFVLNKIFGIDLWLAVVLLALVAGAYTIAGGLASVVWTDVFQAILLLGGGLLVFILGYREVGSLDQILGTGDRAHLIPSSNHPELPWTAIVVIFFVTNIWYYATNQYINQRVLGAKNEWHARAGILFAAFLGIFLTLAVCFPGMIAFNLNPDLPNHDDAYPWIVAHLVGPLGYGIRGLVFAGLIGAIMSTIDSLMNSCSTVITIDFYKRYWKPQATPRQMIWFGRIASAVVLLVGIGCSRIVASFESIFAYFQECWVLMAVPVVVVFFSAILWKRSNNFSATFTLLFSLPLMVLPVILRKLGYTFNAYNLAGILVIPAVLIHVITAYLKPAPNPAMVRQWLWKPSMLLLPKEETVHYPWYKRLLLWWLVITGVFAAIYIYFW